MNLQRLSASSLGIGLLFFLNPFSFAQADQFIFSPDKGSVAFLAIGRPSALKIHGEAEGVNGVLISEGSTVHGDLEFELNLLKTGMSTRDDHMKNKYLEVEKNPKAKLSISNLAIKEIQKDSFSAEEIPFSGRLNLKGVDHEVSGTFSLKKEPSAVSVQAKFNLKLTDFKIEIPSFAGITVAEDVQVTVTAKPSLKVGIIK